jgi:hypothetical protein
MADLKVRNLDDAVASTLKLRAWAKGCVARRGGTPDPRGFGHGALMRRAKALRAAAGDKRGKPDPDSARIIREEARSRG